MSFLLVGGALGGVGLFLLGMRLMTDGLKTAAGSMLRDILSRWTQTRFRGLLSGILVTGIAQSSSAVTVAAIGFVNAGILTLGRAMWVIFGSNVGTTMTGWIVALIGIDLRIEAFALPLLGIGMFLSLSGLSTRRGALGETLAGFGVFFLGIATLKTTFGGIGDAVDIASLSTGGVLNDAMFVGLGFVLTTLMQSSSAVIAIALTAASGGLLTIESGAALVIGANVGTTTTAVLAVIGATANAKRVAVSHVLFNVLTGGVALLLLPLLVVGVQVLEQTLPISKSPATTLALFHTTFNLLGVLLIWPMAAPLARWLETRFVTKEEDEARPRFLDRTAIEVPALAVGSLLLELERLARMAVDIARDAFTDHAPDLILLQRRRETMVRLSDAIGDYARALYAVKMPAEMAEAMAHPFRAMWHFSETVDRALAAAAHSREIRLLPDRYRDGIDSFAALVVGELDRFATAVEQNEPFLRSREVDEDVYQRLKTELLSAASSGALGTDRLSDALEVLDDLHVTLHFMERASLRLRALAAVARPDGEPAPPETDTPPAPERVDGDEGEA